MDFLNQAYGQVSELFRSMTPAARMTTGLLLAVLLVSLSYLFQYQSDSADHFLFESRLTREEIHSLEFAFSEAGLDSWKVEGSKILVPQSQRSQYLAAAAVSGAQPATKETTWNKLVEKHSPLESGSLLAMRQKRLKESELETQIRHNRQIETANVTIEEKHTDSFRRRTEKTAVATVGALGGRHLDPVLVNTVRLIVAFGGGLDRKNVTVVDAVSGRSYAGQGADGELHLEESLYLKHQRQHEDRFREKIRNQLSDIQGVKVEVFVELDKNMKNQSRTRNYEQGVQIRTVEFTKNSSSANPTNQGRPGAATNTTGGGNAGLQLAANTPSENTTSEERNESQRLPAETTNYTEAAPFAPTLVKTSISVPYSHYERIWHRQNSTPSDQPAAQPDPTALSDIEQQEIKRIQEAVDGVIPNPPPGVTNYPQIKVTSYTETPIPDLEGPSIVSTVGDWLSDNWQTLGMFVLAVVGVVMLRGMIQSAQAAAATNVEQRPLPAERLAALEDQADDAAEFEGDDDIANSLKGRFQGSGRSLRDELCEVVREDVDAAANVLQNWIGEPAA